jgi:hypothetical protein
MAHMGLATARRSRLPSSSAALPRTYWTGLNGDLYRGSAALTSAVSDHGDRPW